MKLRELVKVLKDRGEVTVVMTTSELVYFDGYLEKGQMAKAHLNREGDVELDHSEFLEFNKKFETEGAELLRNTTDLLFTDEESLDFEWCDLVDDNSLSARLYRLYQVEKEGDDSYVHFLEKKLSKCILI